MSKKNELIANASIVSNSLAIPDFAADSNQGLEGTDKDSFAIPFLRVLQRSSPQCEEADSAYVPGAKAGSFFNTVTSEVIDGKAGIHFLPCAYRRAFIQWGPRDSDRGFQGEHAPETIASLQASGKVFRGEDNQLLIQRDDGGVDRLVDTRTHFGIVVGADGQTSRVVLTLSSTQIKKSKQLMAILSEAKATANGRVVTPPTWTSVIHLTTTLESNDKGSWHGLVIRKAGWLSDPALYDQAKALHAAIAAGEAKVDYSAAVEPASSDSEDAF